MYRFSAPADFAPSNEIESSRREPLGSHAEPADALGNLVWKIDRKGSRLTEESASSPDGEIGRRSGLKIRRSLPSVGVQVPLRAP